MKKVIIVLLVITSFLGACDRESSNNLPDQVEGYRPIYGNNAGNREVTRQPARPTIHGGKIYTTGHLLFQVEQDSGIHVIDYSVPAQPRKLGFIRSFLCKEVSARNGYIYTNNMSDLVVLDINNMNNVREVGRVANAFPDLSLQYPPAANNSLGRVYFECPDASKGAIAGWELTTLHEPKCWK